MATAATKPANDRKPPQDHRPKNPVRAEAQESAVIEFGGHSYVITRESMDDLEIFELIEDEKYVTAMRQFLGPEQWAAFKEATRVGGRVNLSDFNDFLNKVMEAMGGNFSASVDS